MKFRVVWLQSAVNDLAECWAQGDSTERQAITEAANLIDEILASDPIGSSESRAGEKRIMFSDPLGAIFKVDGATHTVRVGYIWNYRRYSR
jgi:hypothetical protein